MRRRRDEPSNPFASGAGGRPKAVRTAIQKRGRPHSDGVGKPQSMTKQEIAEALAKKRALAIVDQTPTTPPVVAPGPIIRKPEAVSKPDKEKPSSEQLEHERLDEMTRRSAETKAAREALEPTPELSPVPELVTEKEGKDDATETPSVAGPHIAHSLRGEGTTVMTHRTATITAQTATPMDDIAPRMKPPKRDGKPEAGAARPAAKRRRRFQDKGGGKQPQVRKLDRRKYLEYKYAVRAMLDDERVLEEHRSNILGQIWAKGERVGVSESHSFIKQKVTELILPEDVAEQLSQLVKKFTTKR